MSERHDFERSGYAFEQANERAKDVIRELMEVNRATYQGLHISAIARQLGMSREKVLYLRRVLKWDSWGLNPERGAAALARACGED